MQSPSGKEKTIHSKIFHTKVAFRFLPFQPHETLRPYNAICGTNIYTGWEVFKRISREFVIICESRVPASRHVVKVRSGGHLLVSVCPAFSCSLIA